MNEVPIIRKGSYKAYLGSSVLGGFLAGFLFFLISLPSTLAITAFWIGFALWIGIILVYMGIGFPSEEYFKRKRKIIKLHSGKYAFLEECDFELHEDLYFTGTYKYFYFRVIPMTKWQQGKKEIEYDVIEAYYTYNADKENPDFENGISGTYAVGELLFVNHCVGYLPKDWMKPDFKDNFDGLISIFKRLNLEPLAKNVWDKEIGERLMQIKKDGEESRTVHLLKIGKIIDVKYTKAI